MPKLLQINICSAMLSTGTITEDISKVAIRNGWDTYIAYGRFAKPSVSQQFRVGNQWETYMHYFQHRLWDGEGLASHRATRTLVQRIEEIAPDIIHLHNIHDHYLNYPLLFNYLATTNIPIVWTQHDCWAFTGGCMYFDMMNCNEWKSDCKSCPEKRALFCNKSREQFLLKKKLLNGIKNLTFVSVSNWLNRLLRESVQKHRRIETIHNGIDIQKFVPIGEKNKEKTKILGVAAVWDKRKGLNDFLKLREILSNEYEIILVGLTQKQVNALPKGIIGITRTTNVEELVRLYANANVFVNPTYSDNFPTTNLEALACGTPVITYKTGGSPEALDEKTGIIIEQGDIEGLANAIMQMKENPLFSEDCRKRVEVCFDKDKCYEKYICLYMELLK